MWYGFLRFWTRLVFVMGFRLRVFGRENVPAVGGVILAANHQSFVDPPLVGAGLNRPVHFMARKTLFEQFFLFTWLIRSVNAFPVERDRGDVGAVREAMRRLRAGAAVTVFPEATRTHDGGIQDFKPGPFLIASRTGVPVVPTVIDGAFEAWPRSRVLPTPGAVAVAFGRPLLPEEFNGDAGAMAEECRRRLLRLQADLRARRHADCAGRGAQATGGS